MRRTKEILGFSLPIEPMEAEHVDVIPAGNWQYEPKWEELVITKNGRISFDDLLLRLHPAESRIRKLSQESPAYFLAFDLLYDPDRKDISEFPLKARRKLLVSFAKKLIKLT
jgi:ATP-dependent DNA ligase